MSGVFDMDEIKLVRLPVQILLNSCQDSLPKAKDLQTLETLEMHEIHVE